MGVIVRVFATFGWDTAVDCTHSQAYHEFLGFLDIVNTAVQGRSMTEDIPLSTVSVHVLYMCCGVVWVSSGGRARADPDTRCSVWLTNVYQEYRTCVLMTFLGTISQRIEL